MTRLTILGIDGATFDVIHPMIAEGELPHVARILREGVSGPLESEKPPTSPPAWTSMMTGLNPGKHGIYHFIRRELGSYETPLQSSSSFAGKDLMSLLSRRGWTAGALGIPMTYPPFPLPGGYMVSGIPLPLHGGSIAWPPGTAGELERMLGHPYRPDLDTAGLDADTEKPSDDLEQYAWLRDELFAIERERIRLIPRLLAEKPTDFFFAVLSITDRAQHYFWKFHDRGHPGWTEEGARRYGTVVRDAYRLADEAVGAVRAAAGEDSALALVSDHGFGSYLTDFHINNWLEEQGFLVRRKPPYWTWGRTDLGDALRRAGLGAAARLLGPLRRLPVARPKRKTRADLRDVDWSRTRAWCALHGICLNLRGREPAGIVEPGAEEEAVLGELERGLKAIVAPNGAPLVDYTVRSDIYHGPRAAEAPDLQFLLQNLSCLPKDDWDHPALFTERRNAAISGQHRFNGIFAMAAEGLAAGRVLEGLHIQDAAPTVLHAIGQPVPAWMDGRTRADVLAAGAEIVVDSEPEPSGVAGAGETYTADQARAIEESLRGLGYLQ